MALIRNRKIFHARDGVSKPRGGCGSEKNQFKDLFRSETLETGCVMVLLIRLQTYPIFHLLGCQDYVVKDCAE